MPSPMSRVTLAMFEAVMNEQLLPNTAECMTVQEDSWRRRYERERRMTAEGDSWRQEIKEREKDNSTRRVMRREMQERENLEWTGRVMALENVKKGD